MPTMASASNAGWDPVLIISQIFSLQALHYITLSTLVPPLLAIFAEPNALNYEGGATSIGMVMDWREMAGKPTVRGIQGLDPYSWAWSGGKKIGFTFRDDNWDGRSDPIRGWIIAFCWLLACGADIYYLYGLIRKPRLILDFALTLVFNHLVLTTYYSASVPTSLFFWAVMIAGSVVTIIIAEQLCVKREMQEGLQVIPASALLGDDGEDAEEMEMGGMTNLRRD